MVRASRRAEHPRSPNIRSAGLNNCNQVGTCVPDDQFSGALCECNYGFQGKRCEVGPRPLPPNQPQSAVVAGGKVEQYGCSKTKGTRSSLNHWIPFFFFFLLLVFFFSMRCIDTHTQFSNHIVFGWRYYHGQARIDVSGEASITKRRLTSQPRNAANRKDVRLQMFLTVGRVSEVEASSTNMVFQHVVINMPNDKEVEVSATSESRSSPLHPTHTVKCHT
jgi:hypothetical protein